MPEETQQQPEVAAAAQQPDATATATAAETTAPAAAPAAPKVRVRFKADFKAPALHIVNGQYKRDFVLDVNAPGGFEVAEDEYEAFLRPLGFFELVEEKPPAEAADPAAASGAEAQTPADQAAPEGAPATEQPATS